MEFGFGSMIEKLKNDPKKIVLTEGSDPRILEAASRLLASNFLHPVLLGNRDEIWKAAEDAGFNIRGAEIIDPENYDRFDEMVDIFVEIRKAKGMTKEKAEKILRQANYFGTMLVQMKVADCLLGGATYSTADTVRPALQIIKTAPERKIASIAFMFDIPDCEFGEDGIILCADCALMQDPNPEELAEIGAESAASFEALIGKKAKVAFLCHSTKGSANHPFVDKVVEAVKIAKEKYPDIMLDGELQLDAAIIPEIGASKAPGSPVAGQANVLIFPNLEAGNIGYKLIQRIGKAEAYSFLQGLAAPVNDLSRGCSVDELAGVICITAVQAQQMAASKQ